MWAETVPQHLPRSPPFVHLPLRKYREGTWEYKALRPLLRPLHAPPLPLPLNPLDVCLDVVAVRGPDGGGSEGHHIQGLGALGATERVKDGGEDIFPCLLAFSKAELHLNGQKVECEGGVS